MIVVSVQVGKPRHLGDPNATDPHDQPWYTAFFKEPVAGPIQAEPLGLVGDGVADTENHGGPDKAVLAYSADHYPDWQAELEWPELPYGAFGENLTIAGLAEAHVCIGDVWQIGTALFEVSQPRQPCWKLARRLRRKQAPALVVRSGRCGWYLRVVQPGQLSAHDEPQLQSRPHADWTVLRAHQIMHFAKAIPDATRKLAEVDKLSDDWKQTLLDRLK